MWLGGVQGEEFTATSRINLSLEQKFTIKELIKELKVTSIHAAGIAVGKSAPPDVTSQPVPVEVGQKVPQIRSHQFAVVNNQIAIIDPKDRKVVDLIELE
jgi:hypothetical protein